MTYGELKNGATYGDKGGGVHGEWVLYRKRDGSLMEIYIATMSFVVLSTEVASYKLGYEVKGIPLPQEYYV